MKRTALFALLAIPLWGQERIVSTRVYASHPNAQFTVDGTTYTGAATLLWPEHSKHVLSLFPVQFLTEGIQLGCTGWTDNIDAKLDGLTIAVTANRDITYYKAACGVMYRVVLRFNPGGYPFSCAVQGPTSGKVYVDGSCYDQDAEIWVPANSALAMQAFPPPGYVFMGWPDHLSNSTAYATSILVNRPMTISPKFSPAVSVTLETSPPGLQVLADRTPVNTPVTVDWAPGSQHTLAPVSPQNDITGKRWVFDTWGHGGSEQQAYTVQGTANVARTIMANYVPGMLVNFLTKPAGLKLSVDGRDSLPNYSFVWKNGSKHTISAPVEQVDARGRKYVFAGWSNGAAATHDLTVTEDGINVWATYEMLGKLTLRSSAGTSFLVQDADCPAPCVQERRQGTNLKIAAPAVVALNDGARLEFQGWSDGGARERIWVFSAEEQALTVMYRPSYLVAAIAEPAEGARFRFEPSSADGFYAEGAEVAIALQAEPGYRLRCWEGDLNGQHPSGVLKASGPRWVKAVLEKVPYIAPPGVRNAAGETLEPGVAAGSLVSIYGANLAPGLEVFSGSPLPQTLSDVTVRVGARLLPLVMVSPGQITAQLPSELKPGDYALTVRWEGHDDVTVPFAVVRSAPGLFAVAAHPGGTPISADNPAHAGETVTLAGTGFGPYEWTPLDGFAVPDSVRLALVDPVDIVIGDRVFPADSASAAAGQVGVTAIRFILPEMTGTVQLRARVNGRESNAISLEVR